MLPTGQCSERKILNIHTFIQKILSNLNKQEKIEEKETMGVSFPLFSRSRKPVWCSFKKIEYNHTILGVIISYATQCCV